MAGEGGACPAICSCPGQVVDNAVIGLVRDIIARYGIDVSANARRLENFLADLSKKRRLENAALVAAVKEGIPAELLAGSKRALPGVAGDRLVQLLREHQGLDADVARWAVRAWAQALDVTGLRFRAPGPAKRSLTASQGALSGRLDSWRPRWCAAIRFRQLRSTCS